mgnify:CR=1 FL=1
MPIYEYRCQDCGHVFEKMTTISKADDIPCVACESETTERQLSVFGVGKSSSKATTPCASGACPASGPLPPCASGMGGCPSCM